MFEDAVVRASLQGFFEPVASWRGVAFPAPIPYVNTHPLPYVIQNFNNFISRVTVVFAEWTELGELLCIYVLDGLRFVYANTIS